MAQNPPGQIPDAGSRFADRRTVPRFAFDAPAELLEPIERAHIFGRVTEISQKGCFAEVPDPFAAGPVVRLKITNGAEIFTTWARELYHRSGSGVGLRFIDTAPDQTKIVMAWVHGLEKIEG